MDVAVAFTGEIFFQKGQGLIRFPFIGLPLTRKPSTRLPFEAYKLHLDTYRKGFFGFDLKQPTTSFIYQSAFRDRSHLPNQGVPDVNDARAFCQANIYLG